MRNSYKSNWFKQGQRYEELKNNKRIEEASNGKCLSVEQLLKECKREVWQGLVVGFLAGVLVSSIITTIAVLMNG